MIGYNLIFSDPEDVQKPFYTKAGSARNPIKNKEMIEPPARRLAQGAKIPKEDTQGLKQFSFAGKRQKKRQPCPKTLPGFGQYITLPFTLGVLGVLAVQNFLVFFDRV